MKPRLTSARRRPPTAPAPDPAPKRSRPSPSFAEPLLARVVDGEGRPLIDWLDVGQPKPLPMACQLAALFVWTRIEHPELPEPTPAAFHVEAGDARILTGFRVGGSWWLAATAPGTAWLQAVSLSSASMAGLADVCLLRRPLPDDVVVSGLPPAPRPDEAKALFAALGAERAVALGVIP